MSGTTQSPKRYIPRGIYLESAVINPGGIIPPRDYQHMFIVFHDGQGGSRVIRTGPPEPAREKGFFKSMLGGKQTAEAGETTLDPNSPNASADAYDTRDPNRSRHKLPIYDANLESTFERMTGVAEAIREGGFDYDAVIHGAAAVRLEQTDELLEEVARGMGIDVNFRTPVPEDLVGMQNSNSGVRTVLESENIDYRQVMPPHVKVEDVPGIETVLNMEYARRKANRPSGAAGRRYDRENPIIPPQSIKDPGRTRRDEYSVTPPPRTVPTLLDDADHDTTPSNHRGGQMGRHRDRSGNAPTPAETGQGAAKEADADADTNKSQTMSSTVQDNHAQAMVERYLPTVAQPADDPVDRALEAGPGALSDADRGRAMRHDAYWESADLRRDALHHAIRAGYRTQYGTGPQTYDETGKPEKPVELAALPAQTPAPRAATGQPLQAMLGGLGNLLRQAGQATGPAAAVKAWQTAVNALDQPTETEMNRKRPPRGTLAGLDRPDLAPPLIPAMDDLTEDGVFGPKTAAKTRRVLTKRKPLEIADAFTSVLDDVQNKNHVQI